MVSAGSHDVGNPSIAAGCALALLANLLKHPWFAYTLASNARDGSRVYPVMDAGTALMPPSLADTWLRDPVVRRRIGLGLLVFTLGTALIVTLYPFRFDLKTASLSRIDWRLYYPGHSDRDLVQNLLMLAPFGAGLVLVRFGRASLSGIVLEAGALGLGTALVIETLQIFERTRFPQAADVWRNGTGCIAGAVAATLVLRMIDRGRQHSRA